MTEEKQEGQKTIVSFVVGLLIGGLLVWAFSSPADDKHDMEKEMDDKTEMEAEMDEDDSDEEMDEEVEVAPALSVGEGDVSVVDTKAGSSLALESVTYPISEGWIGVRDYTDGQLGGLLGVSRFSESQGLVPTEVFLQRSTEAGKTYAVVIYTENGDRQFSMADDVQLDSIFATFTAK